MKPRSFAHRSLSVAALAAVWILLGGQAPPRVGAGSEGFRGIYAMRGGRVIEAENAGRRFVPGSVNKLVVVAAALHHLGPDYRATTVVEAGGEMKDGALAGDLVVRAGGDPTWSRRFHPDAPHRPLAELAAALAARGLTRIEGDVAIDVSRFPGRTFPKSRALSDLAYGFAAPTSAFALDENTLVVTLAGGERRGAPARLGGGEGVELVNRTTTVGAERHGRGTIDFLPVWGEPRIIATGEFPSSEPLYRIELSHPTPVEAAGRVLLTELAAHGITVTGGVRVLSLAPLPREMLAQVSSPRLAVWIEPILEDSHNWLAEMLLHLLAAEVAGSGRLDLGLEVEKRFLEQVVGLDPSAFTLDDGSGISTANQLTPQAVVELLRWAWKQPWRQRFVDALAGPGEGTLVAWGPLPLLAAKTGTLEGALALAGYLDPASPDPIVFACFFNHDPGAETRQRREIALRLRRWR